jgi:hypothetical protein
MRDLIIDGLGLGGLALIGYGAFLLHPGIALGWFGALLFVGSLWLSKKVPHGNPPQARE